MPADNNPFERDDEEREAAGRRKSLVALGIMAVLLVGGVVLTHELRKASQVQDCLMMTKAANCAHIENPEQEGRR